MRLIDADKLVDNQFKNDISYNAFVNLVKRQPTIDAVPVVRCKDCVYWNERETNKKGFVVCKASHMDCTEYDFCSWGEKVTE